MVSTAQDAHWGTRQRAYYRSNVSTIEEVLGEAVDDVMHSCSADPICAHAGGAGGGAPLGKLEAASLLSPQHAEALKQAR